MRFPGGAPPSVPVVKLQATAVVAVTLALVGCGESASDKAKKKVCSARADIQTQINTLQKLPVSLSSVDAAKTSLTAIKNDVQTIAGAQGDLKGARKQSVQDANAKFKSQIEQIVTQFTTNLNLSQAQQQVKSAGTQLADSYKASLGKIDCS